MTEKAENESQSGRNGKQAAMPIYRWETDSEEIVRRLSSAATLKLCVKLLDEPWLIEGWIEHHAKIVGLNNIIIADNGSTDPHTLEVYEKFGDRTTIFQFRGPHNEIHWHPRFSPLFDVIKANCRYFAFVDVDERLVVLNSDTWNADNSIVAELRRCQSDGIIPTTWLLNTLNSFDTFSLLDTEFQPKLENNLKWGKPLLPARLVGIQPGIHNQQFQHFDFSAEFGVHFFLLHFTQLPERRIAANLNKLVSRGVVDKSVTSKDVLGMKFDDHPDKSILRFVEEIRIMLRIIESGGYIDDQTRDTLTLDPHGEIRYFNDEVRAVLSAYLEAGDAILARMFGVAEPGENQVDDAHSLLAFAKRLRDQGKGARAEILFHRGMALYPDFLDQYQGPAFRKELVRTLLARRDWDRASEYCPTSGDPGGTLWHHILFARAFAQTGDIDRATQWWKTVLEHEPGNGEARGFLDASSASMSK